MHERWRVSPLDFPAVHHTRHAFARWLRDNVGGDRPMIEYEIVFGELLTNAVRFGKEPIYVDLKLDAAQLSIRIEDWGDCFKREHPARALPLAEGGRGLEIVRLLAAYVRIEDGEGNPCKVVAIMPLHYGHADPGSPAGNQRPLHSG
jgi:anti-sigma regulatory factor (Ser/Thr protein kinase)